MEPKSSDFFSSTYFRNALVALASSFFLILPAYGDIIDVQIVGTVSGSGGEQIVCCFPGSETNGGGFQFSGVNTQLGAFSRSGKASADGTNERVLTSSGLVQQTTEVTSNNLTVDLVSDFTVDAIQGGQWGAGGSLSNDYAISFTLTTESFMHVTSHYEQGGSLHDNINLGPPLNIGVFDGAVPEQTLLLVPGQYTFRLFSGGDVSRGPGGIFNPQTDDFANLTFSADFTPAVPEPRWISMGVVLVGIVARTWRSRVQNG